MKLSLLFLGVLGLSTSLASAAIKTEAVDYQDGDVQLQGFLVYDDAAQGKRPGVVIYPEWWGLTDYPKHRAEQLAEMGYVAFAADMYGKGVTTDNPQQAGKLSGPFHEDRKLMRRRAMLAVDQIKKSDRVDSDNLAAIGYCFGGTCVLELARMGADLKGVVSFHGDLDAPLPAEEGAVKAKILACTGGADAFVPDKQVVGFMDEMRKAKADWQVNVYAGAKHAFTNPNAGKFGIPNIAYNKQADQRSWQAMKDFFGEIFPQQGK